MNQKFRYGTSIFGYYLIGFLVLAVTHEATYSYLAQEYNCNKIVMNWIPTQEALFSVKYSGCDNFSRLKFLQSVVEIVGYQLYALYTGLVTFMIFYREH